MQARMIRYMAHPFMGSFVILAIGIMLLGVVIAVVFGEHGWQEEWCRYNIGAGSGNVAPHTSALSGSTTSCTQLDSSIWEPWKLVPWFMILGQLLGTLGLAWPVYFRR